MLSGTDHKDAKRRLAERAAQSRAWLASVLPPIPSSSTSTHCATSADCRPAANSPLQPNRPTAEHSVVLSVPGHRVRRFGLQPRKQQHQTGVAARREARVLKEHNPPAVVQPAAASKHSAEHPAKRMCISSTSLQQPAAGPLASTAKHSQSAAEGRQQQEKCPSAEEEGSLEPGLLKMQQQPTGKRPSLQLATHYAAIRHTECQTIHKQCSDPSKLFCPNCGDFLEDLADTESGQAAHVSSCHEDRHAAGESSASEVNRQSVLLRVPFLITCVAASGPAPHPHQCSTCRVVNCSVVQADKNEEQRYNPDEEMDIEVLSEGFCDTEVDERVSNGSPAGADAAAEIAENCQAAAATTATLAKTELVEPEDRIASWLHGIGCSQYTPLFMQAGLPFDWHLFFLTYHCGHII